MKLDIEFIAFAGLLGVGAYLLINRAVKSFYATNVIPVYNYPVTSAAAAAPPPIAPTGGTAAAEEEAAATARHQAAVRAALAPPSKVLTRPSPQTVSQAYKFGQLSQQEIAEAASYCKPEEGAIPVGYPGFSRRPDGLLQWDGGGLPDFLQGHARQAQQDIQSECSREVAGGEGKSTFESCAKNITHSKWMIDALRTRPWCPGVDLTPILGPAIQKMRSIPRPSSSINRKMRQRNISSSKHPRVAAALNKYRSMTLEQKRTSAIQNVIESARQPTPIITASERAAQDAMFKEWLAANKQTQANLKRKVEAEKAEMQRWVAEGNVEEQALKSQRRASSAGALYGSSFRRRRDGGF